MKNIISLLIVLALALTIVSCGDKSEDPAPTNQNINNTNPQTWTSKTFKFWQEGSTGSEISKVYLGMNQSSLTNYGSLALYQRQKTSVCNETSSGAQATVTQTGRYYYQFQRGLDVSGYTVTHAGYIDIANDGVVTLTETTSPTALPVEYTNCGPDNPRFTVNY